MDRRSLTYILTAIFTIISAFLSAQNYDLKFIEVEDGLPQADVKSVAQDDSGALWICTNDGLSKYDGERFVSIPLTVDEIASNQSRVAKSDATGSIWIGTLDGGLFLHDSATGSVSHIAAKSDTGDSLQYIFDLEVDSQRNTIWIVGRGGLVTRLRVTDQRESKYESKTYNLTAVNGNKSNASDLILNSEGAAIVVRDRHTYIYNTNRDLFEEYLPKITNGATNIDVYGDKIYALKNRTLYSASIDKEGVTTKFSELSVGKFFITQSGDLYLFCADGIYIQDLNSEAALRKISQESLQVLSTMESSDGAIYVGTLRRGMVKIKENQSPFTHLAEGEAAESITEDSTGKIWIGSIDGELNRLTPNELGGYDSSNLRLCNKRAGVFSIFENDLNQEIIVCSQGSSYIIKHDTISSSLSWSSARAIIADSTYLWVATYSSGLQLYDANDLTLQRSYMADSASTLPSNIVRDICKDSDSNIYVATAEGLVRIAADGRFGNDAKLTTYRHNPKDELSISYDYILPVTEGIDGTLWVGTLGGGLNALKIDNKGNILSNRRYNRSNGLSNNSIKAIVTDRDGVVWVTTNRGLNRIDKESGEVEIYTPEDGLQSQEFSEFSGTLLSDGRVAVGGINGVNIFNPKSVPYGDERAAVRAERAANERKRTKESETEGESSTKIAMLILILMSGAMATAWSLKSRRAANNRERLKSINQSDEKGDRERYSVTPAGTIDAADEQFIISLEEFIEKNITDPNLRVESLCEGLKMSKVTLNKRLKRACNKTANSFIRSVRMRCAAQMLSSGNHTIAETTYAIGLNDLRHFRESFKHEYGVLPSEYLSSIRSENSQNDKSDEIDS